MEVGVGHGSEGVREGLEGCWKGVREVRIFMMPFLNRPDNWLHIGDIFVT